jgi:F420-dependent oxidoreductase-like protein
MALQIGIHTGPQNCTYEELRRVWRFADSSGFYWVSIWDHFYDNPSPDGRGACFEGVSSMTALAAETTNVRVGSLVFSMGYRNPALLAKAAATIDHISNGRLELGLGGGWYELEHTAYGYAYPPIKVRLDMLEEGVQIIKSMLTQEVTSFSGEHFQVQDAYCFPRPVQAKPRIWIGGRGERRTLRIVARHADGWNAAYVSAEEYARLRGVLEGWCETEGRDPGEITRSVNTGFYMGVDQAEADRLRRHFEQEWGSMADVRRGGMLFGTPSEVTARIGDYVDAGAQGLNIALRAPFNWDALQAFAEEVLPAFAFA